MHEESFHGVRSLCSNKPHEDLTPDSSQTCLEMAFLRSVAKGRVKLVVFGLRVAS
ncbi:hypothetical protein RISK_004580 [Rhodopirellula islandica]|uniref:Uncharacterized protein n=1 Tax=Rhodopirellula islandica TaxID=595434 RepID=A0A0J1B9Q4_RHOIS|nr:hypothetical protein RISK_004580 [Rhodopirellula islandica]